MRQVVCLLCVALCCAILRAGEEQDRFEEQAIARCAHQQAERAVRGSGNGPGERANTIHDLDLAFPGKLPKTEPGKTDDEGARWFELVAGTADEWRKTDAVAAGLGPMFERWKQRLELGPVPSIKRDEFIKFSKVIIHNAAAMHAEVPPPDTNAEADKIFRILDLNCDGELTGTELSATLLAEKVQADTNKDGRISKDEYREFFRLRVDAKAEKLTTVIKANQALMRELEGIGTKRAGNELPAWFATLDLDKDKQISLYEWRKSGRPIAEFQEMDLNGDGLLTVDEYLRWAKQKAGEEAKKKREEAEMAPDEEMP